MSALPAELKEKLNAVLFSTFLAESKSEEENLAAVTAAIEAGADVEAKGPDKATVLMWAASSGYLSVVEFLMKSGADVNARCPIRRSALMDATSEGHGNVVDLLLEHGANPCLVSSQGRKAYDMAAESGHEALAESLRAAEGQYSRWEGSDAKRAWIVAALFSKPSASCLAVGGASAAPAPV